MNITLSDIKKCIEKNTASIPLQQRKLVELVGREPYLSDSVEVISTKTKELTIKHSGILLHSVYAPEKEAIAFCNAQHLIPGEVVLVYGFGLGYHLRKILHAVGSKGKVFVLEPNIAILKAAFSIMDLSDLLEQPNFSIITGETEEIVAMRFMAVLDAKITNMSNEVNKIIIHQASLKCMPPSYERLRNTFELLLIDRKAPEVFEGVNKKNLKENIAYVLRSPGIRRYFHSFANTPAFFINAGPSLDNALPLLKQFVDKALLFCCDTALPALVDQNITPDFVLTVDPQERSGEHFIGYHESSAFLLFTPTSASEVVRKFNGRKIVVFQKNHSLTKQYEDLLSYKGFTNAGSSVSCMGLDILMNFGCNPLIFVGMDYSFPGGKLYSSNVAETKKWFKQIDRFTTLELIHQRVIQGEKIVTISDKFGNDIVTHQSLYLYLKQIEDLIAKNENVQFYNFFSQGANIDGVEDLMLIEQIKNVLNKKIDKEVIYHQDQADEALEKYIVESISK